MNILDIYAELKDSNQRFIDEVFEAEIYRAVKPQLTIIDAGAYEGEFSFYALPFAKKIYAFEPDPRPFKIFNTRITKYNLTDKIKLYDKALAAKTGERPFHNSGYGGSRLLIDNHEQDNLQTDRIRVKTISLGDVFKENNIEEIDILKIDIEDGEYEVISTPEFPQLSKKIKMIIGEHLGTVATFLTKLGYKATNVGGENTLYVR